MSFLPATIVLHIFQVLDVHAIFGTVREVNTVLLLYSLVVCELDSSTIAPDYRGSGLDSAIE